MIREPDPGDVRGREPTNDDRPVPDDRVVAPPLHLAPPPEEAEEPGDVDLGRDADTALEADAARDTERDADAAGPVVDLRPVDGPRVSPARPNAPAEAPARRSTDAPDAPTSSTTTAPGGPTQGGPVAPPRVTTRHTGLADRTLSVVAVPLVVLALTVAATTFLLVGALGASRAETRLERAAIARLDERAAVDELNAAVLSVVAAGIGQSVVGPDELARRSGDARAVIGAATAAGDAGVADDAAASADRAATAYVDAVDEALERTGGDPLELGNELSDLDELHDRASAGSVEVVDDLRAAATDEGSAAARRSAFGLLVAALGLALAGASLVLARRRLSRQLDRPVRALRGAVAGIGSERTTSPMVQGPEELVVLGAEIDAAAATVAGRIGALERRAAWGERSRAILEALELADDEPDAYEVVSEALGIVGGDHPGELLLSERGTARLTSVAASSVAGAPGCPVDLTSNCVALRRGQVSVFDSSESINACPKLRDRASGPCSAVCVPVTVAGRQHGVLHVTGSEHSPPGPEVVEQLVTLSSLVGARLGSLRTLESSRQEASTDGLTGLPNRRTLEAEVADLLEAGTPFVMVLADLDKFKRLNDNFGHEVGDKALQLFAGVLRDNVRGNDVVARLGGEEFVLVYPNMSVEISVEAIDRLRLALSRAVGGSRIPPFTCSFGIAHSTVGGDGDVILRVADAGLLRAKELGGDRAVVADEALAADVFAEGQD